MIDLYLLWFALVPVARGADAFIVGDLVAVRQAPSLNANRQVKLHINTPVDVLEAQGDWRHIRVAARPDSSPVEGWVAGHLLGDSAVTMHDARQAADAAWTAGRRSDAIRWAQRAYALDVSNRTSRERVERMTGRRLPQRTSFAVGICDGTRVSLLAHFDTNDGWLRIEPKYWFGAGALPWFVAHGDQVRPVVGSPFAREFATPLGERGQAFASDEPCEGDCVLRLGACSDDGALYATIGLSATREPRPFTPRDLMSSAPFGISPSSALRPEPVPEVAPKPEGPGLAPAGSRNPRWFDVDRGSRDPVLGVFETGPAGGRQLTLMAVDPANLEVRALVVDY